MNGHLERTDIGNANQFAAEHHEHLRHVPAWGWLAFDGTRWARDTGRVMRCAQETVRGLAEAAARRLGEPGAAEDLRHAVRSASEGRLRAMINVAAASPLLAASPDDFDRDLWLLNVENGTLDLRTGELRPHNPGDLLTKIAGTAYNPDAGAPIFDRFLRRIFGDDLALIDWVQRWAGYSLTGETSEHVMLVAHGRGANGKSTLLEALQAALGDYATVAGADLLLNRREGAATNDLAALQGVRLVSAAETDDGRRFGEATIKALTGGDTITARFLFGEYFKFKPQCKIILATNHRPTVKGTDEGLWRRLRLVPFNVVIPEAERDQKLPDRLRTELPGILAWAVRGCAAWQARGLGTCEAVTVATHGYRAESDTFSEFLREECVVDPDARAFAADLLAAYNAWCAQRNEPTITQQKLGRILSERGFTPSLAGVRRTSSWTGLGLLTRGEEREREVSDPKSATCPREKKTREGCENGPRNLSSPLSGPLDTVPPPPSFTAYRHSWRLSPEVVMTRVYQDQREERS